MAATLDELRKNLVDTSRWGTVDLRKHFGPNAYWRACDVGSGFLVATPAGETIFIPKTTPLEAEPVAEKPARKAKAARG